MLLYMCKNYPQNKTSSQY